MKIKLTSVLILIIPAGLLCSCKFVKLNYRIGHPFAYGHDRHISSDTSINKTLTIIKTKRVFPANTIDEPYYFREHVIIKDSNNNVILDSLTITIKNDAYKIPLTYIIKCKKYDFTIKRVIKTKISTGKSLNR